MIDIGANLTNRAFSDDYGDVLARARDTGVEHVVITGTDVTGSRNAAALAGNDPDYLSSTAGVHPHDAKAVAPTWLGELTELLKKPEVRAVGETGLDYHRNYSPPAAQRSVFDAQIALALELGMPLFVHDRESGGEVLEHLRAHGAPPEHVVIHCFTGTAAELDAYLEMGYSIGITGWICDERRGTDLRALVPRIPDSQLMVETDAPFLLPRTIVPRPGSRRNEPANLAWVIDAIAEVRGQSTAEVAAITAANARRFFRL